MKSFNPYTNEIVGEYKLANEQDIEKALETVKNSFIEYSKFSAFKRSEILHKASQLLSEKAEEFAQLITEEIGKPINQARYEINKSVDILKLMAEETLKITGQIIPLTRSEANNGKIAMWNLQPLGQVLCISPYNFPVLTSIHKVAPALAAGNTVIYKPSPHAPIIAEKLACLFFDAGLPENVLKLVHCENELTQQLAQDKRIKAINFTGSSQVGWNLRSIAPAGTKFILELGGNAPVIIHEDANLDLAVSACVRGSFAFSGQVCISVQRVFIHKNISQEFIKNFIKNTKNLKIGDPQSEQTDLGPLITKQAYDRFAEKLSEAKQQNANILTGGNLLKNNCCEPAVLLDPDENLRLVKEEAFAPVVNLITYTNLDEAIEKANKTNYGLSAGLFTQDINRAFDIAKRLDFGTVMINDSATFRSDEMPISAMKESGIGFEGPAYAIRELSASKVIVIKI